jgi:hypothetical protein
MDDPLRCARQGVLHPDRREILCRTVVGGDVNRWIMAALMGVMLLTTGAAHWLRPLWVAGYRSNRRTIPGPGSYVATAPNNSKYPLPRIPLGAMLPRRTPGLQLNRREVNPCVKRRPPSRSARWRVLTPSGAPGAPAARAAYTGSQNGARGDWSPLMRSGDGGQCRTSRRRKAWTNTGRWSVARRDQVAGNRAP